LLEFLKNLRGRKKEPKSFVFSRPIVALHSDDWGRVGVRDKEGFEWLRSQGLRLGEHPYDLYSLETAEDVANVAALLGRHVDSTGGSASLMMNACTANLDFTKMRSEDFRGPTFLPLSEGLPAQWRRPGLIEAYRAGVKQGVFKPALHGLTHFCRIAVQNAVSKSTERSALLRLLWQAETPYIFWRMPWVGYEYWNPERPRAGFLDGNSQRDLIREALNNFRGVFKTEPVAACAPGYRANNDTWGVWAQEGIRVAENGSGSGLRAPHFDDFGLLHVYRVVDFEPSQRELDIGKYMEVIAGCLSRGLPAIISVHSINFHSTLKDFRTRTIAALDQLLTALEKRYPELLYVGDDDIYSLVTEGVVRSRESKVTVKVLEQDWHTRLEQETM
jgi:hypothetical protein